MADEPIGKKISIPRNMRPRSTPNAEINAQKRDELVREFYNEPAPYVKDVPLRGYVSGGMVKAGSSTVVSCKNKHS